MPAERIPGFPGVPEPHFRTSDRRWVDLDTLVRETCGRLDRRGMTMTPRVVKATIQLARQLVEARPELQGPELVAEVVKQLRPRRVLLTPGCVQAALLVYALLVAELDVVEINEF